MIRNLCKDQFILAQKAIPATFNDISIGNDLLDTLKKHAGECVGMAANMIGINKAIIAVVNKNEYIVMYNPIITKKTEEYKTKEGCLCLIGERECTRYKSIQVKYQNEKFQYRERTFKDFSAEIIQHEIDHLNGIII